MSEYREVASETTLQRPAQRLLATQLPKHDEGLMSAATQVSAQGTAPGWSFCAVGALGRLEEAEQREADMRMLVALVPGRRR